MKAPETFKIVNADEEVEEIRLATCAKEISKALDVPLKEATYILSSMFDENLYNKMVDELGDDPEASDELKASRDEAIVRCKAIYMAHLDFQQREADLEAEQIALVEEAAKNQHLVDTPSLELVQSVSNFIIGTMPEGWGYDFKNHEVIVPEDATPAQYINVMQTMCGSIKSAEEGADMAKFVVSKLAIKASAETGVSPVEVLQQAHPGSWSTLKNWVLTAQKFGDVYKKYPRLSFNAFLGAAGVARHKAVPETKFNKKVKEVLNLANKGYEWGTETRPYGAPWIRKQLTEWQADVVNDDKPDPEGKPFYLLVHNKDEDVPRAYWASEDDLDAEQIASMVLEGWIIMQGTAKTVYLYQTEDGVISITPDSAKEHLDLS